MTLRRKLLAVIVTTACITASAGCVSYAIAPHPLNGAGVSPAITNLTVLPHQASLDYSETITNSTNSPLLVTSTTANFTSVGISGTLQFLSIHNNGQHDLASSLHVLTPRFILAADSSKTVTIRVQQLSSLTTGGHYGAVLFQLSAVAASRKGQVSVHQTLASLVFLTTSGRGTYRLSLNHLVEPTSLIHFPNTINLVFNNAGNVQVVPQGYILLAGSNGHTISKTIINPNSALILPGTERLLQTSLTSVRAPFWPGRYTVHVYYRYAGVSGFSAQTLSFIYLNLLWSLSGCIIIVLVFIILIKYIFSVQRRRSKAK